MSDFSDSEEEFSDRSSRSWSSRSRSPSRSYYSEDSYSDSSRGYSSDYSDHSDRSHRSRSYSRDSFASDASDGSEVYEATGQDFPSEDQAARDELFGDDEWFVFRILSLSSPCVSGWKALDHHLMSSSPLFGPLTTHAGNKSRRTRRTPSSTRTTARMLPLLTFSGRALTSSRSILGCWGR